MLRCTMCNSESEPMITKFRCVKCYKTALARYHKSFIARHEDYMKLYRQARRRLRKPENKGAS